MARERGKEGEPGESRTKGERKGGSGGGGGRATLIRVIPARTSYQLVIVTP